MKTLVPSLDRPYLIECGNELEYRDQLSLVRRLFPKEKDEQSELLFCGVGDNVKKVPFHFTIQLPKPLKERVIVERDSRGRITSSKVPVRTT